MPIAMTDGTMYENSLDMLFAKDMPSREETDQQQKRKALEENMPPDMRGPPVKDDAKLDYEPPLNEEDQLHPQDNAKEQNDPYNWGFGETLKELDKIIYGNGSVVGGDNLSIGANRYKELGNTPSSPGGTQAPGRMQTFKGPYTLGEGGPESNNIEDRRGERLTFGQILASPFMEDAILGPLIRGISDHYNGVNPEAKDKFLSTPIPGEMAKALGAYDLTPEGLMGLHPYDIERLRRGENPIGVNGLTAQRAGELAPGLIPEAKPELKSEQIQQPSPYGETYDKFVQHLETATKLLNPSFIPTAEQFRDAPWKEKLGFILGTSMMLASPGLKKPMTPGTIPEALNKDPLQFWKEGLGTYDQIEHPVINTLRMAEKGGSKEASSLLETYNKIEDPVAKQEFGNTISEKLRDDYQIRNKMGEMQAAKEDWQKANPEGLKNWSPEEDTLLAKSIKEGKSIKEIASAADRTQAAIRGRIKTLKNSDTKFNNEVRENFGNTELTGETGVSKAETPTDTANVNKELYSKEFEAFLDARENNPNKGIQSGNEPASQRLGWDKHSDNVYNLKNQHGEETGSAVYREHSDTWVGSRFSNNQIVGRREFNNVDDAMNYAEYKTHRDYSDRFAFDRKGLPKVDTELEGKSGISTPNTVPRAANRNDNLQIDDPVMDAAIDKTWENFGRANKDNLPLISPDMEPKLQATNPAGFKKLKQFELEMDYKYKQPPGRRHWLSDLTKAEADRYRKLYNDIDKVRPVE
jgi:hypothetical protein